MAILGFSGTPRASGDVEKLAVAQEVAKVGASAASPPASEITCRSRIPAHAAGARLALAMPLRYHILAHAEGAHIALRVF